MRLEDVQLANALHAAGKSADALAAVLREKSEGNFLYAAETLNGIERGLIDLERLEYLPPGLAGLYEERFRHEYPDEECFSQPRRVLEVVSAAQEPLDESQLALATGLDRIEQLPKVLRRVTNYLSSHMEVDGRKLYTAYHKSLTDWLADESRRGALHTILASRGHQLLANMCWDEYQTGSMSRYPLAFLPTHLLGAERWNDLTELLQNQFYLDAKARRGLLYRLAEDLQQAAERLRDRDVGRLLRLLGEAVRRDIRFIWENIEDNPEVLFQCLWNTCWWYDCPATVHHHEVDDGTVPPWELPSAKLCELLESWKTERERVTKNFLWARSLIPPAEPLGGPQRAIFRGHQAGITDLACLPDGTRFVSSAYDGTLRLWDLKQGRQVSEWSSESYFCDSLAVSPDGRLMVAAMSLDYGFRPPSSMHVIDLQNNETMENVLLDGKVNSLRFSPDGSHLAAATSSGLILVFEIESGWRETRLEGHKGSVEAISFSPDGRRLASVSSYVDSAEEADAYTVDFSVRVWNWRTGDICWQYDDPQQSQFNDVSYSQYGERIATCDDQSVRIWNADDGELAANSVNPVGSASRVLWTDEDRNIVSISGFSLDTAPEITVRSVSNGAIESRFRGHTSTIDALALVPGEPFVLTGAADRTVRLWDLNEPHPGVRRKGHITDIESMTFSPDGSRLVSASRDGLLQMLDCQTGETVFLEQLNPSTRVLFSQEGNRLAFNSDRGAVMLEGEGDKWQVGFFLEGLNLGSYGIAFSPDGRYCAFGTGVVYSTELLVVESVNGRTVFNQRCSNMIAEIEFSGDSRFVATRVFGSRTVEVLEVQSGKRVASINRHQGDVRSIAFSPDGRYFATSSYDCTVRLWSTRSWRCLKIFDMDSMGPAWNLTFSSDSLRLVASTKEKTIVWDVPKRNVKAAFVGVGDNVSISGTPWESPLRALSSGGMTRIEERRSDRILAVFPGEYTCASPDGVTWAGSDGSHLFVYRLQDARLPEIRLLQAVFEDDKVD